MSTRWERLLDQKPIPLREHLLEEVARLLDAELRSWPLPVQEVDVSAPGTFVELLSADSPRPPKAVFTEAIRLARWDLGRATDSADEYFRNRRYREAGLVDADRPALLLVTRWLLEQVLSLAEATEGRLKRPELSAVLDRVERRLVASTVPGLPLA